MNDKMINLTAETVPCHTRPIIIDAEKCVGCLRCVNVCQVDVLLSPPNGEKAPVAAYPGECWYCGACVMACGTGAIKLRHPLMNRARFVERGR